MRGLYDSLYGWLYDWFAQGGPVPGSDNQAEWQVVPGDIALNANSAPTSFA